MAAVLKANEIQRERERERNGRSIQNGGNYQFKKITPAELMWATMYPAIAANQRECRMYGRIAEIAQRGQVRAIRQ